MNNQEIYKRKLTTAEEIVKNVKSGDNCAAPSVLGEPPAIMQALAAHVEKAGLSGVRHNQILSLRNWDYLKPEMAGKITLVSWYTGSPYARAAVQQGRADFMPQFYSESPRFYEKFVELDIFWGMVSSMDKHGYMSFGAGCSEPLSQMKRAKKIFLEVNPNMPRTHGSCFVHISQADAVCENNSPLPEAPPVPPSDIDRAIGNYILEYIPNGACIQLGIGGMPNVVGENLLKAKDLGIHTEMFTEVMVKLIQQGAVNNTQKNIHKGKTICSFAMGTKAMYDFLDDNPAVEFHQVDYVNDPRVVSQNDNVISINACLEVDLLGQVCSESIGPINYSGTGGQVDFVRGASWSRGGRAFIATSSTAKNDTITKIKPILTPGAHVTTSKNDVDAIVTEYGAAELKGKTASQRAKAMIAIAHPKFRDELMFEAKKMNLMV